MTEKHNLYKLSDNDELLTFKLIDLDPKPLAIMKKGISGFDDFL